MTNVPKLRFKEFSGKWEEKQLGEIATFYNFQRVPLTESDRIKGKYPYYGASGIIDYVNDYIFDGEYILLGEDGANIVMRNSKLVFLATGKFWVNNHAHIFQAKNSNAFLCEALERINYVKYNTGTAQPKLNSNIVKKIKLFVPSKQEQEKIATFLTSVDTKIEQLIRKEELLEKYKKSIMQKIFSQKIRFKTDKGIDFCNWEEKTLSDYLEINATYGIVKAGDFLDEGIKMLRGGDIKNGQINLSELPYVSQDIALEYKRTTLKRNDIVIALVGYPGEAAVIPECLIGHNISRAVGLLRLKNVNHNYLVQYLNSQIGRKNVLRPSAGSAQQVVNLKDLNQLKIPIPHLEEQTKIANFLLSIDSKIEQNQMQLIYVKEFKKALVQKLFV